MNPELLKYIRTAMWHLPSWLISTLSILFGMMVALNVITWEALRVFFDQPFDDWFGEIWNYLVGGLITAGGIMYDPRSEKVNLLVDELSKEDIGYAKGESIIGQNKQGNTSSQEKL